MNKDRKPENWRNKSTKKGQRRGFVARSAWGSWAGKEKWWGLLDEGGITQRKSGRIGHKGTRRGKRKKDKELLGRWLGKGHGKGEGGSIRPGTSLSRKKQTTNSNENASMYYPKGRDR